MKGQNQNSAEAPPAGARSFRFTGDFSDAEGNLLGTVPIEVDWVPAYEAAQFAAVRAGEFQLTKAMPSGRVAPCYESERGAPYVEAFDVTVDEAGKAFTHRIARTYAREACEAAAETLVADGRLERGATFYYTLCAYSSEFVATNDDGFSMISRVREIPVRDAARNALAAAALTCETGYSDGDIEVFMHRDTLRETIDTMLRTPLVETGGGLVGHICREDPSHDPFIEITGWIPAPQARSKSTSLEFTPDAWERVAEVIDLRGRDELLLGWAHYHPHFCRNCPIESRRLCAFRNDFFSSDDVNVHRTCFSAGAYQTALLITNHGEQITASMFGWRGGRVVQRAFDIVDEAYRPLHDGVREVHADRRQTDEIVDPQSVLLSNPLQHETTGAQPDSAQTKGEFDERA